MNSFIKAGALLIAGSVVYKAGKADGYLKCATDIAKEMFEPRNNPGCRRCSDRFETKQASNAFRFDNVTFETREYAKAVLAHLRDMIAADGVASVSDLYTTAGIEHDYVNDKYGWISLKGWIPIRPALNGYMLDLPRPIPID